MSNSQKCRLGLRALLFLQIFILQTLQQDSIPLISDFSKIENTFQQLKNLSRIIVQPPETIKIPLQDYFKGQNLTYTVELKCDNPAHNLNHSLLMQDQNVFQFSRSIKELHFIDFEQYAEEHSLPQTSLLYTDSIQNKYLIFVDFSMKLNIYNISLYYLTADLTNTTNSTNTQSPINRVVYMDLYNSSFNFSTDRQCNNLLQIDDARLIVNCKLQANPILQQNSKSVLIDIDLSNLTSLNINYLSHDLDFDVMRDGYLELFDNVLDIYYLLMRENTTNSYISLVSYTSFQELKIIGQIKSYDLEDLQDQKLQIQDIKKINFMNGLAIASDYNLGILIWSIYCNFLQQPPCKIESYYRVETTQANTISILESSDSNDERVMFIQRIYPPQILELTYAQGQKPFISKIYKIPQDLNLYTSMSLLDANKEYILTQLVSIQQFKPLIRVYQRQSSFYQILHSEFKYSQFIDSGVYIKFINKNENFFVLKTSDFFQIMVLQDIQFTILAQNVTVLDQKQLLDHQMQLYITVQNYTYSSIQTAVDILFINRTKTTAMIIYGGTKKDNESIDPTQFTYSCGDTQSKFDFDMYFSGPENDYRIVNVNIEEDYFIVNNRQIGLEPQLIDYKFTGCGLNAMIQLQELNQKTTNRYLSCVSHDGDLITIIDVFQGTPAPGQNNIKSRFRIPNASIIESVIDENNSKMIVFSKLTVDGSQGLVLHVFNLFNVIMWESSIDLYQKYSNLLGDFQVRDDDSVQFYPKNLIGAIVSTIYYSDPVNQLNGYQKLAIFKLNFVNGNSDFAKILAVINIDLDTNVKILQVKFTDDFMWVLLSDHHFIVYEMLQLKVTQDEIKTQFRLKRILDFKETVDIQMSQIINFKISDSKIIAFYQNRTVALFDYDYYTLDLERTMVMPMYLDKFPDNRYEFVLNNLTKKAVYDTSGTYLFVMYTRYTLNYFAGYTIFIYDTGNRRHNTLLIRYDIPGNYVDNVDPNLVRLQVLQLEDNLFRITLITEKSEFFHFKLKHKSQISVNPNSIEILNQRCAKNKSIKLNYQIYSTDNPDAILNISISAINRGFKVYNEFDRDNVTISLEQNTQLKVDNQQAGKYQLLSNFHGFNMNYNQSCFISNDTYNETTSICLDVALNQKNQESNKTIEFSSNDNTIKGFFIIDDVFIFFDQSYIRVFLPETQQYEQRALNDVFQYSNNNPMEYYLFAFQDFTEGSKVYYLGTQDDSYQFSLAKILIPSISDLEHHLLDNYVNFNNRIYLKPVKDSLELPTKITSLEMYRKSVELFLGIFVYDPSNQNTLSTIELYHIHVKQAIDITFEKIGVKDLTLNNLYLDSFKINAIKIFNNSNMLIVGIESFGVMIYNLETFQIQRVISINSEFPAITQFKISSIVFQSAINLKLIIPKIGIVSLLFDDANYQQLQRFKTEFFNNDIDLSTQQVAAVGPAGFGYIEGYTQDSDNIAQLRYFCWDSLENTKSLGTYFLAKNLKCNFVQELSWKSAKVYFNMDVNSDFQCQTVICDSTLKLICFNFHPSLLINPNTNNYLQEVTNQTIVITAQNQYSNETMYLDVYILRQSRAVATGYYAGFIIIIAFGMIWAFNQTKQKLEKDIKKKSEKKNPYDPVNRTSESFLTKMFKRKSRLNFNPYLSANSKRQNRPTISDTDSSQYKYSEASSRFTENPTAIN